jgi:hypothetical protein
MDWMSGISQERSNPCCYGDHMLFLTEKQVPSLQKNMLKASTRYTDTEEFYQAYRFGGN